LFTRPRRSSAARALGLWRTSLPELDFDSFYIEDWSHWLDLKIVALTIPALFRFREDR
jgi:lipopolysaccharide/colanic/teichoic acid biosynthesis glycosyltransferase